MRKLAILVILLITGCDSDFYKQDTSTWFGFPPAPPADKKDQAPAPGNADKATPSTPMPTAGTSAPGNADKAPQ
jgi:hypothetical protein